MTIDTLTVTTPTARYPVVIAAGALAELPERLRALGMVGTLWFVSDSGVYPFYGTRLEEKLKGAGYDVRTHIVAHGEGSKDLATLSSLYDWMIGGDVERRDCVIALGGGVVGDLAGFAAASVLRGIGVVQVPTTIQALVDAAIGGKTGVNHPLGKNLIGAFHQPRLVLGDTDTLRTLPARELRAGWAEVIKHGVIRDAGLFELLEQQAREDEGQGTQGEGSEKVDDELFVVDPLSVVSDAILRRAVAVKVAVVSADEREGGERIILNYGHTLGHALEAASGYGRLLHGEAVSIGMHAAARIANRLGLFSAADVERQRRLLIAFGLPVVFPPDVSAADLLARTLRDKKVQARRIRWVLPTAIGSVVVRDDVPQEVVEQVVRET